MTDTSDDLGPEPDPIQGCAPSGAGVDLASAIAELREALDRPGIFEPHLFAHEARALLAHIDRRPQGEQGGREVSVKRYSVKGSWCTDTEITWSECEMVEAAAYAARADAYAAAAADAADAAAYAAIRCCDLDLVAIIETAQREEGK